MNENRSLRKELIKMDAVKKDVEALVQKELEAANKKFPLFNSAHEGYAVLLEEAEELDSDSASIKYDMQCLWGAVKGNNTEAALETILHTYECAVNAAVEAIQTAAMCKKFKASLEACEKMSKLVEIKVGEVGVFALCPNCEINLYHIAENEQRLNNIKFCPHCGQMLSWR